MSKNITVFEKNKIKNLYLNGYSYKDIQQKYGYSSSTISLVVKGLRTHKESLRIARANGKCKLSEKGRKVLSDKAIKQCLNSSKTWTKPERIFKQLLNEIKINVKFPEEIKKIYNMQDDDNALVYFQYPIQRYLCDFVYPEKNIIFRVMGDFWHANPLLYNPNKLLPIQKFNVQRDKNKRIFLEKHGWYIIDFWESDIYYRQKYVKNQAARVIGNPPLLHRGQSQFKSGVAYSDLEWKEKLNNIWFKKGRGRPKAKIIETKCKKCGGIFKSLKRKKERKYCSTQCFQINRRKIKNRPPEEQLLKEVKETNYCAVGRKYGVSDNTIRKWLK